jgi:hypothetical protein
MLEMRTVANVAHRATADILPAEDPVSFCLQHVRSSHASGAGDTSCRTIEGQAVTRRDWIGDQLRNETLLLHSVGLDRLGDHTGAEGGSRCPLERCQ